MKTCEIISVGTELLLGDILNTDAQFLAQELAKLGFSVMHQSVVGDNHDRLLASLNHAAQRSDIIILSGGLGPTPDDITKEVACEFFSKELVLHKESLERMTKYFTNKGLEMPESNKKQAMLPADCVVFENNNGTAPGLGMEKDGKHILLLPGPPRELKPMFFESAVPYLKRFSDKIIISHNVRTFGIGESAMSQLVEDLLESENPTVAPYAKDGEALLRVTAMADNEAEADRLCAPVIEEITKRLGVREDDLKKYGAVSEQVAKQMAQGVLKLSGADVAVSVTGIAGPNSDGTDKPVGLSYIGLAHKNGAEVKKLMTGRNDRDYNRYVNASNALNMVRMYLRGENNG